ncbi:hypothetical protein Snov_4309 [Ancylobacter novellus DSM 506]|uniref:DUF5681 domain-containing protein n=1 Tax=Ancylobacter novellus (strain ATCC 8093 / DSM 506 / JCM 20403 / CCM 1077 / IAM 12100 / NBRC 12443 / NCIMB 10456) TaxID=639283 RepID=D7A2P4_ANCN5|nr:DUF5681 domain-containing protein [Ancylobacter novellus]ADH91574.1 hypothetical protein Snov_4309 [Ancylobacter novellus DSM 506]
MATNNKPQQKIGEPQHESGKGSYRCPPVETRFKPGQSGNPGGRRKGSRNVSSVLDDVLGQEVTIQEGGKRKKVTVLKAVLLCLAREGLKGNIRAIDSLLDRAQRSESKSEATGTDDLPAEDNGIIERALDRQTRKSATTQRGPKNVKRDNGGGDDER